MFGSNFLNIPPTLAVALVGNAKGTTSANLQSTKRVESLSPYIVKELRARGLPAIYQHLPRFDSKLAGSWQTFGCGAS